MVNYLSSCIVTRGKPWSSLLRHAVNMPARTFWKLSVSLFSKDRHEF